MNFWCPLGGHHSSPGQVGDDENGSPTFRKPPFRKIQCGAPKRYVCWLINPMKTIMCVNQREIGVMWPPTEPYRQRGPTTCSYLNLSFLSFGAPLQSGKDPRRWRDSMKFHVGWFFVPAINQPLNHPYFIRNRWMGCINPRSCRCMAVVKTPSSDIFRSSQDPSPRYVRCGQCNTVSDTRSVRDGRLWISLVNSFRL